MDKITKLADKIKSDIDRMCTTNKLSELNKSAESAIQTIIKLHSARMNEYDLLSDDEKDILALFHRCLSVFNRIKVAEE